MKFRLQLTTILILSYTFFSGNTYSATINKVALQEDLTEIISKIKHRYVYLERKKIDLQCIKNKYSKKIDAIKSSDQSILFFENILNEFYDNHVHLNTNTDASYRLSSPLYVQNLNGKEIITSVWQSQINNLNENIIGAEVLTFNQRSFNQAIEEFNLECADKDDPVVKEWIANKVLSGRYDQTRVLQLKLISGKKITLDIDELKLAKSNTLLSYHQSKNIGVIRINDSLGQNALIAQFDQALASLKDSKGIIIDLRNTNSGGNTYVARGIMGRFINKNLAYQKHAFTENYSGNMPVKRSWIETVSPRGTQYKGPVVILVGRWTGSMGEGMAIGFDAMGRAEIIGSKMSRLAGSVQGFPFNNSHFGFLLSTEELFHINGIAREKYIPANFVQSNDNTKDLVFQTAVNSIAAKTI